MSVGKINTELLRQMVDEKLVSVQKHPTAELFIYNYSPKVQYDKLWNEDKKTFALRVMDEAKDISAILFNMYNGKKVEPVIWKMVRPTYSKAFKNDNDI